MTFTLRILRQAQADVREIHDWIETESPAGARRWLDAFETAANRLIANPYLWPVAPESGISNFEVRHFIFKTRRGRRYRALYTIVGDEIRILHVRGAGQDLMRVLGPADDAEE